jgi:hypothetical protein
MTEAEWLSCTNPFVLLGHLPGRASCRKLCLFVCACCDRIRDKLTSEEDQEALAALERAAEGPWDKVGIGVLEDEFVAVGRDENWRWEEFQVRWDDENARFCGSLLLAGAVIFGELADDCEDDWEKALERAAAAGSDAVAVWTELNRRSCGLVSCIFGNPFQPRAVVHPDILAWQGGTPLKIARGIYEERAFDRMPILADALEDAGCADAALLGHLRSPAPHVRGCWVIDALTGRE